MSRKHPSRLEPNPQWVEQSELSEDCPCGSQLQFGACCGSNLDCDCKSHYSAGECCYSTEDKANEMKSI